MRRLFGLICSVLFFPASASAENPHLDAIQASVDGIAQQLLQVQYGQWVQTGLVLLLVSVSVWIGVRK